MPIQLNGHMVRIKGRTIVWFNGLVVMISVLHTEGPEFDPQLSHLFLIFSI